MKYAVYGSNLQPDDNRQRASDARRIIELAKSRRDLLTAAAGSQAS